MADQLRAILNDDAQLTEATNSAFANVDTNKSGKISFAELKVALVQIATDFNRPIPSEDQILQTFTNLDTDSSNDIDATEFKVYVRTFLESLL